ncbi:MAG: hypothetical protein RIQ60_2904 [Pseudomonadota bacterium]|jgi:hypothetical protein
MTAHRTTSPASYRARHCLLGAALALCCGLLQAAPSAPPASAPGSDGARSAGQAAATAAEAGASAAAASPDTVPPTRVFVLFDIEMEASALGNSPAAVRQARDTARQHAYDAITARLKEWGARQGVLLDAALFSKGKKVDVGGRRYTHLLVEKISQAALENGADGLPFISTRKWVATAYDTSDPGAKKPAKLGSDSFMSDGSACFETEAPTQAGCRSDYLHLLSTHLRWIDASWGEVDAAAAARPARN